MQHPAIAVIGGSAASAGGLEAAYEVGRGLAAAGVLLVCGGLGGIMAAAARGCREGGGEVLGLLPGNDAAAANDWVTIAVPTGLGHARNVLVVQAARAVIAIEGEFGTLSEIAIALKSGRAVISLGSWQHGLPVQSAACAAEAVRLALAAAALPAGAARQRGQ